MKINARLLCMLIAERYPVTEYGCDLKTEKLSLPVFYVPGIRLKEGQVYIARSVELPASCDTDCLFLCTGSRPAHTWNYRRGKALFLEQRDLNLLALFNSVQEICDTLTSWTLQMHTLAAENASMEKFVAASLPVFENCITITDYNLQVLVNCKLTEASGRPQIVIDRQYERIPDDAVPGFLDNFGQNIQRREPFHYKGQWENPQGDNYCINLYQGDNYVGTCTLWEKLRPFRESDFLLFQQFASFIRRILSAPRTGEPDIASTKALFLDLLQCFPVSSSALNRAMAMIQVNLAARQADFGSWYCVAIRSANQGKTMPEQYLCTTMENLLPRCTALYFDHFLVCFCMITSRETWEEAIRKPLEPYLKDMNFRAGVSFPFTDLYDSRYYYLQARAMLKTGEKAFPALFLCTCKECLLPYMVRHSTGEFPLDLLLSPGLKALLASENGVDYRLTLQKYLDNECNASRTAQELYLHRTSLQSRLDKIKSLVSLDTPEERLYLRICLKLCDGETHRALAGTSRPEV